MNFWSKVGMPTRLLLVSQVISLGVAVRKGSRVGSIAAGLTIAGLLLIERQAQNAAASKVVTKLGQLRLV